MSQVFTIRVSTAQGCKWLAIGLGATHHLLSLDLGANNIDRQGMDFLADGLCVNRSITRLKLNSLKFGEHIPPRKGEVSASPSQSSGVGWARKLIISLLAGRRSRLYRDLGDFPSIWPSQ